MPEVAIQEVDLAPFEKVLSETPYQKGAVILLLQKAQELYKYVPKAAMELIADHLKLDVSQVYGVATFYTQFRLKPVGEYIIKVCHGTACHVAGAERVSEKCSEELGVGDGETTGDKKFTLEKVACVGCCSLAPVMMIGEETYGRLSDKEIKRILKEYKEK